MYPELIVGIVLGWLFIGLFILFIIYENPFEALFKESPDRREAWGLFTLTPLIVAGCVWALIAFIFVFYIAIAIVIAIGVIYYSILWSRRAIQSIRSKPSKG